MKITQNTTRKLSSLLRDHGEKQEVDGGVIVYLTEDMTAAFGPGDNGKTVFQGLSFEMTGRDFHVLPNLDLVISETIEVDGESTEEVFVIEDLKFGELVEKYLVWRSELLDALKF